MRYASGTEKIASVFASFELGPGPQIWATSR